MNRSISLWVAFLSFVVFPSRDVYENRWFWLSSFLSFDGIYLVFTFSQPSREYRWLNLFNAEVRLPPYVIILSGESFFKLDAWQSKFVCTFWEVISYDWSRALTVRIFKWFPNVDFVPQPNRKKDQEVSFLFFLSIGLFLDPFKVIV